ncbi:MAG: hypothetical protein R3F19_32015 [Verrucomicrobiales bacterium]
MLSIIGGILAGIGGLIMLIFGIIILIKAFQESVLWGLGSIFVPFVSLVFVIKFWDRCKKPFLYSLGGLAIYLVGLGCLAPSIMEASRNATEGMESELYQMEAPVAEPVQ